MMADTTQPKSLSFLGEPQIKGPHGQAWLRRTLNVGDPKSESGLGVWIVWAPWAHPVWHSYVLSLIHLRPIPGEADANIYREGATHELVLLALNPEHRAGKLSTLYPANFAAQLIEDSDDKAQEICEHAVREICQGILSPDTDFRSMWIDRFGGSMVRK